MCHILFDAQPCLNCHELREKYCSINCCCTLFRHKFAQLNSDSKNKQVKTSIRKKMNNLVKTKESF